MSKEKDVAPQDVPEGAITPEKLVANQPNQTDESEDDDEDDEDDEESSSDE